MKLKFKNQAFQTAAVDAVCDLFLGQEKKQATFSVAQGDQMNFLQNDYGIGNALLLDDATILTNMREVQKRNRLPLTDELENKRFCIEMETGTGKTYVYTKTIFELHKRYGFCKFIIVVPSVAIREGIYKSFELTAEHFGNQYDRVPCRYFIYNSGKLSDVRQFATSSNIEIMIINIDAFKKAENIINQQQDRLGGETAMRYIQDCRPVVIVDEPQSVDNTPKAKEAIASLNPLCVLRYSATHRENTNMLYRLTPVDAYQMGLVKQIVVSSNQVVSDNNRPYVRLISVTQNGAGSTGGSFKAKLEIDVRNKAGAVSRKTVTVKPGSDLFLLSGQRGLYDGYQVSGIDCTPGGECVEFGNTETVALGKAIGSVDEQAVKYAQIRRTIEAHLDKELRYSDKGIKVLSLFFIDEVKKYRTLEGAKGIYARMFEQCYAELLSLPKYEALRNRFPSEVSAVHNGYFSQDKKGTFKDTKGDTIADYDTYSTIMRDKEWLLSFDCPLRFIWSHSALKEGWDNPNVFQVCTLIEQKSAFTCRQKIGRGLRLCVNQDGERIEDKNINILHVMANESFSEFADALQKEIEQETGVKFGVLQLSLFTGMVYPVTRTLEKTITPEQAQSAVERLETQGFVDEKRQATAALKTALANSRYEFASEIGVPKEQIAALVDTEQAIEPSALCGATYVEAVTEEHAVTYDEAAELMQHFEKQDYVTKSGKIKDTMKAALQNGTLDLPGKYEGARTRLENLIRHADQCPPIRDASREVTVHLKKEVLVAPAFQALWDKIKQKTAYRVQIDTETLVKNCVKELKEMPPIPKARIVTQTADIHIRSAGVSHMERGLRTMDLQTGYELLPHILSIISEETLIKRSTVRRILLESGREKDFLENPQAFLEQALEMIRHNRHSLAIDGIRYVKLDGQEYYAMEIFDAAELTANLDKDAVAVQNSVYDYVIYDSSTVEKPFAKALDDDPDVKMFFKLPSRFKIDTPIGSYNPDWAVYLERDGVEKLYLVMETKGTTHLWDLKNPEQLKIRCGEQHFKALDNGVRLYVAKSWNEFKVRQ